MPADRPIYLDYNATTPVDAAVADAIVPWLRDGFGNPSSTHAYGKPARDAVGVARKQVAGLIGADDDEIVFTGGGSEASNLAIKGVCLPVSDCHVITTAVEHPATAKPVEFLRRFGVEVTVLPVDRFGLVDPGEAKRAITPRTKLVSLMHSNNETGTLMPVKEVATICRERGVLIHTDCAQSLGKVPVDVGALGVDLLTIAGHKLYAPKGVGALYVRRGVQLESLVHGAGHESGRRAGTENVPYLVGLGVAAELARRSLPAAVDRQRELRDRLYRTLLAGLGERLTLNGHSTRRLPNTLNVNFVGHVGPRLLARVPSVAASNGAACHETPDGTAFVPSAVLTAMGVPEAEALGAVRLTVGRWTTEAEVDRAAELLIAAAR